MWNDRDYDDSSVGEVMIAGEDSAIIVSMENTHLRQTLTRRPLEEGLVESVKDRYSAAIAYYLLLREVDRRRRRERSQDEDASSSPELNRLAQTVSLLSLPIESLW